MPFINTAALKNLGRFFAASGGPPVYEKLRKSGAGGSKTSPFQPVMFKPNCPPSRKLDFKRLCGSLAFT